MGGGHNSPHFFLIMIKSKQQLKQYASSALVLVAVAYGLYGIFQQTDYPWKWYRIWEYFAVFDEGQWWAGEFLYGMVRTVELVLYAIALSFFIGAMVAWARFTKGKIANGVATLYVTFIRNTPVLVQIYLMYFILAPMFGMDRFVTGVVVLSMYEGAFVAEIIRGAIQSVSRGQWEAGQTLGLKTRVIVYKIICPQALRLMIGPMTNVTINLLKHSSIVSVIAVQDLTTVGRDLISDTYLTLEIWLAVAFLYWLLSGVFALIGRFIEKQIKWANLP